MTGRDRLESILNRRPPRPPGRMAWTTLVDAETRSVMPRPIREMSPLDFYRHVGCDILQFGNYGLPEDCRARHAELVRPAACRAVDETVSRAGDVTARRTATPWGTLTATFRRGHPVKYPVESLADLRALTRLWEGSRYEPARGAAESCRRADDAVGDDGLHLPALGPSPVQQLIEMDVGLANFYYFLHDHPARMRDLMAAMHRCRRQEYEIVARLTPAPAIIAVENTSSTLTSPQVYREHSLPHLREYAEIAHARGKKLILHMCGRLRDLLEVIAETGMDGINALTPPPVGDCTFEHALDVLGEDLVILGGVFPPEVLHKPGVTAGDIRRALDELYTPRVRRANFLLWVAVDGLPTPLERFLVVRDWFERQGRA